MSTNKLPFLDILLCKEGNKQHTDIYYKTTDTHPYSDFRSCHSKHAKSKLSWRYYYERNREGKNSRHRRITDMQENTRQEKILPLVITNDPNNPNVTRAVKKNLKFQEKSNKMKTILAQTTVIISRRQPKNLKQQLTQVKFSNSKQEPSAVKNAVKIEVGCANIYLLGILSLSRMRVWPIKSNMTCKAKSVIYIIIWILCKSFYVGQTLNLRKRVTLHKEQIHHKQYRHLAVSEHLKNCNEGKFNILPIYQCKDSDRLTMESREREIITILKPDLHSNNK